MPAIIFKRIDRCHALQANRRLLPFFANISFFQILRPQNLLPAAKPVHTIFL
jgi:hypothetical protein